MSSWPCTPRIRRCAFCEESRACSPAPARSSDSSRPFPAPSTVSPSARERWPRWARTSYAIRRLGRQGRIHHVHLRAVRGRVPRYVETFINEGDLDMLEALRAYKEAGYTGAIVSDHTPGITGDIAEGKIGRSFSHGYIRALIQAVNSRGQRVSRNFPVSLRRGACNSGTGANFAAFAKFVACTRTAPRRPQSSQSFWNDGARRRPAARLSTQTTACAGTIVRGPACRRVVL